MFNTPQQTYTTVLWIPEPFQWNCCHSLNSSIIQMVLKYVYVHGCGYLIQELKTEQLSAALESCCSWEITAATLVNFQMWSSGKCVTSWTIKGSRSVLGLRFALAVLGRMGQGLLLWKIPALPFCPLKRLPRAVAAQMYSEI